MGNFTTSLNSEAENLSKLAPRNTTLDLIKQYARVCTPLADTAFYKMIAN